MFYGEGLAEVKGFRKGKVLGRERGKYFKWFFFPP
jgi:hypothetical protein